MSESLNMKKYGYIILILCMGCLLAGCHKEESAPKEYETLPETTATDVEKESQTRNVPSPEKELSSYDNNVVTWGPGIQTDHDNRPIACVAFQKKYEMLGADFIREKEPTIYLTFDEGYENGYTEKILDVLKEKQVQAVFFVTMPYAEENTALMNRFVEEGHVIGNHSVTHPSQGMPSLSVEQQKEEYQTLHEYVKTTYGYEMYLFRPPAGIFSQQSLAVAASMGYRTVLWSFAYADWDPDHQSSREMALQKLKDRLHPGAIYLLHAVSQTNTEVLGEFIDYVREQGYQFGNYR